MATKVKIHIPIILLILVILNVDVEAQANKKNYRTRMIVVNYPDSIIKTNVLLDKIDIELNNTTIYYWSAYGEIHANKGGYSGQLLCGSYQVFDVDNNLITQGAIQNGVKNGSWKSWYNNGEIKSLEIWKKGVLEGKQISYTQLGDLKSIQNFRKGKRHGLQEYFRSGQLVEVKKYTRGRFVKLKYPDKEKKKNDNNKLNEEEKKQSKGRRTMFKKDKANQKKTETDKSASGEREPRKRRKYQKEKE